MVAEPVNGRIDRTFIDENGTPWIIDYKSRSHERSAVEAFLDNERERYRWQFERYRRLFTALDTGRSVVLPMGCRWRVQRPVRLPWTL